MQQRDLHCRGSWRSYATRWMGATHVQAFVQILRGRDLLRADMGMLVKSCAGASRIVQFSPTRNGTAVPINVFSTVLLTVEQINAVANTPGASTGIR